MRTDQHRLSRVVRTPTAAVRVRCRPMGSGLRDLTDGADVVNWFSLLPGLLGLLGWLLHVTVFRSRWSVTAQPLADLEPPLRLDRLRREDAEEQFTALVNWLEAGHALGDFVPSKAGA